MRVRRTAVLIGLLSGFLATFCVVAMQSAALGEASDTRPVTLVVPIAPGGGVDIIARMFAALLSERLKQPWVVENRPGAGGLIGLDSVAKATPDGHTLITFETSAVLQQWLHRDVPFDVVADFAPVAQMATTPLVLFAGPSSPVTDFKGLIAYAKVNPGKLTVGTPGVGTPHSLAAFMLNALAGVDMTQVYYKGTAPSLNDLLGGQIPLIWATPPALMQYVETGKVKALAVASPKRIALLPDVPTVSESGVAGFDVGIWFGIAGPAKIPTDVIARVGREVAAIDAMADVRAKTAPLGYQLDYADAAQFAKTIAADHARYGKVIRDAGIKPD
jgi:tripartite-type tricarboxylate transporter receptor subunit TctC